MEANLEHKLKLLSGMAIDSDVGKIQPLTLREIIEYGYLDYLANLSLFAFDMNEFLEKEQIEKLNLKYLDFLLGMSDQETLSQLEVALSMFLKKEVRVMGDSHVIVVGSKESPKLLHRDNFDYVREVIRMQNAISTDLDEKMNKP
jgi:hypothetical protein